MVPRDREGAERKLKIVVLVFVLLVASTPFSGCGKKTDIGKSFILRKNGKVIGTEKIAVRTQGNSYVYVGQLKRPYSGTCALTYRSVTVQKKRFLLENYFSHCEQAGVRRRVKIKRAGLNFKYYKNDILTFSSIETDKIPEEALPFDTDSALMMQLLLDAWRGRGMPRVMSVLLPERSPVAREISISKSKDASYRVNLSGLTDARVTVDEGTGQIKSIYFLNNKQTIVEGMSRLQKKTLMPRFGSITSVKIPAPGGVELSGVLCRPTTSPPYPVVIMVGDTGFYDRWENGFFVYLADSLLREGFAVLGVDRRGGGESTGKPEYSLETAISDLCAEVDFLLLRGDIDAEKIIVVGHGEGGYVAAKAAAKNPYIYRIVMLGTPADRIFPDATLRRISLDREDGLIDEYDEAFWKSEISWLENVLGQIQSDYVSVDGSLVYLGWMRSFCSFIVDDVANAIEVPVLLVYGSSDRVAPPDHGEKIFEKLRPAVQKASSLKIIRNLDHAFGRLTSEENALPFRAHIVASDDVITTIARWLKVLQEESYR